MATGGSTTRFEVPFIKCDDLRHFKETLKLLRGNDDQIVYKLNQSVPTQSFQHKVDTEEKCRSLYQELMEIYKIRENGIKHCIKTRTEDIQTLKGQLEANQDDYNIEKQLRSAQSALRVVQSELIVEDVVKARSMKVFNERCWKAYSPPSSP